MAVQDKILSAVPANAGTAPKKAADGTITEVGLQGQVGTLAIGKPGDITSKAFGPIVRAEVVATAGGDKFGTYVAGRGVVVNSNDVANMANYDENFVARKGQTVGYLTYGTCVMFGGSVYKNASAMNFRVLAGTPATATAAVPSGQTGVTAAEVVAATFGSKIDEDGSYEFVATVDGGTTTWKLGTETVTLADYGITATGTAANGDKITVTYATSLVDVEVTGFKA